MTAITVCICTFRRAHITETLRSLAQLTLKPQHIIVADNDDTASAKDRVEAIAQETGMAVTYIHAPARNISIARNACLDAATTELVAFIDDDELVTPGWLENMLAASQTGGADVVLGPVRAIYDVGAPKWMRKGDFHSTMPVWVHGRILTGYSCNALFRKSGLRFRKELGRSGGEDTAFFAAIVKAGGTITFAPAAMVTEAVTADRATLGWLLKRRFRSGQTHGLLLLENSGKCRASNILKAGGKSLFCLAMALLCVLSPERMRFWLLRGVMHAGVVSRLLGKQEIEQYG